MAFTLLQQYGRDNGLSIWEILLIIFLVFCVYSLVKGSAMLKTVLSHWHHRFESVPFSSQEFYQSVESILKTKEMSRLSISRVGYAQGGFLSPNREYLRVGYKEYIYDICAAPFATGYFVSWWLGETGNPIRDFFINLPMVGKFFNRRKKTFFELDTEIMFKETVSSCVREAIEKLTENKGLRKLADAEWKEYNQFNS